MSWDEYQKLVLSELRRLNANLETMSEKIHKNERDIAVVKVRSSLWGSASGMITVIIALFIQSTFKRH